MLTKTPTPPYYAVIFTSIRTKGDNGYGKMAQKMVELGKTMPGFLGIDSARNEIGISVSYWQDLESIENWRRNSEHAEAKKMGIQKWYEQFSTRIAKVEVEY